MSRMAVVILAVAAVAVALGLAGAAVLIRPATSVGPNVFVNPAGIIDAFSTPTVAVNPRQPNDVVVAYREDRPNLAAALSWSTDDGQTFRQTRLPLPAGLDRPFFPDAAFGTDGMLYVSYVDLTGRGNVPGSLWVARSADGGRSLSPPTMVASGETFQPRITVGAPGVIDLTWLLSSRMGQPVLTGALVRVMMARSVDGGLHWSTPAAVSPADGHLVAGASAVSDGNSVVVAYQRFGTSAGTTGPGGTALRNQSYDLVVTRSSGGIAQFSPPTVAASAVHTTQAFSLFFPQFPSLAVGPGGSLYLAWGHALTRGSDALVARSNDLGTSWSTPVRANDNRASDGTNRALPTLSVAPDGRVDVVMIDERNDPSGIFAQAYLASSHDSGRSFHDVLLSSASFDTRVGPTFGGDLPPDEGSHLGIVSEANSVHAAWADSRLGSDTTGRQDIVTVGVSIPRGGLGARTWFLVVAAVLLVGALTLLAGDSRRRAREPARVKVPTDSRRHSRGRDG